MPTTRLAVRTLVGALVAMSSVGVAPGVAAADTETTTTLASPGASDVVFGDEVDIDVEVESSSGPSPTDGTSTLLAREAGRTAWVAVATSTSPTADFLGVRPRMSTTYKVVYSGSTDTGNGTSWAASTSAPFTVAVARRITHPTSGFDLSGRVTPRFARKLVLVRASRDKAEGYTLVRAVRTDRRGRYTYVLPKRRGTWYWIIRVKGDSRFRGNAFAYETTVY